MKKWRTPFNWQKSETLKKSIKRQPTKSWNISCHNTTPTIIVKVWCNKMHVQTNFFSLITSFSWIRLLFLAHTQTHTYIHTLPWMLSSVKHAILNEAQKTIKHIHLNEHTLHLCRVVLKRWMNVCTFFITHSLTQYLIYCVILKL